MTTKEKIEIVGMMAFGVTIGIAVGTPMGLLIGRGLLMVADFVGVTP